jgi:hypothetical protein
MDEERFVKGGLIHNISSELYIQRRGEYFIPSPKCQKYYCNRAYYNNKDIWVKPDCSKCVDFR